MPFTKDTVKGHLEGKFVVGSYAIRTDDTCTFLAADFDGSHWKEDVAAYKESARALGIDVGVERSRSGNGAHAWIFFIEPTPARDARNLGMIILSKAMRSRHELPLTSYDRFFPSQDTMPSGGFGNLIALPLQQEARKNGNTAFLDDSFKDQQMAIISLPTRSAVRYVPLRQIVAFVLRHFVAS